MVFNEQFSWRSRGVIGFCVNGIPSVSLCDFLAKKQHICLYVYGEYFMCNWMYEGTMTCLWDARTNVAIYRSDLTKYLSYCYVVSPPPQLVYAKSKW